MTSLDNVSNADSRQTTTPKTARCFCYRLLVVLHQQHHQPDLLRALQHQLPAHLLAHPDVPLEPQATAAGATLHLLRRLIHHHEVMRGTPTRMREHWHVTRYFIAHAHANARSRHDDFGRYGRAKNRSPRASATSGVTGCATRIRTNTSCARAYVFGLVPDYSVMYIYPDITCTRVVAGQRRHYRDDGEREPMYIPTGRIRSVCVCVCASRARQKCIYFVSLSYFRRWHCRHRESAAVQCVPLFSVTWSPLFICQTVASL